MQLMIHTIQVGDLLTMIGPDGAESEPFTLAEPLGLRSDSVWIYREYDAPIVVDRCYGLDSSFRLHSRRNGHGERRRP
ncbi:hypothetical protein [uncultured Jatrophihabitans sp.]|uniref:hypothetical protein n=1 Tax=uncultured Jatrophihabitans sp. TaxID=1610747 RepID=UPI0035CA28F3